MLWVAALASLAACSASPQLPADPTDSHPADEAQYGIDTALYLDSGSADGMVGDAPGDGLGLGRGKADGGGKDPGSSPVGDGLTADEDSGGSPSDSAAMDVVLADAAYAYADADAQGAADADWSDAAPADTAPVDTTPADTAAVDTAPADAGPADAAPADGKTDSSNDGTAAPLDLGACKKPGLEACGKTIGGESTGLYVCSAKLQWKLLQTCQKPCQAMPEGVPDRCPEDLEVPGSLVTKLDVAPYVEQNCKATTYKGWPYAAQKCTYSMAGLTTSVTTATPPPATVAAWIVDSAVFMPAVWALRYRDPDAYKKALKLIAEAVLLQSSRVFPLEGGIIEQMSGMSSAAVFGFYHGITQNCTTGCYCRINSLQKQGWCNYQQFLGKQTYNACMSNLGSSGLTAAWAEQCLGNHIDAWKSSANQHFRAKAHQFQQGIKGSCANAFACSPDQVLAALQGVLQ